MDINRNYAELMVSDTIRWSRNIYYTHVSGEAQERLLALEKLSDSHGFPLEEAEEEREVAKDEV